MSLAKLLLAAREDRNAVSATSAAIGLAIHPQEHRLLFENESEQVASQANAFPSFFLSFRLIPKSL